jgi:hypothetical protein
MRKLVLFSVFVTALLVMVTSGAQAASAKKGLMARVGFDLANLYQEYEAYLRQQGSDVGFKPTNPLLPVIGNRVVIDAVAHRKAEAGNLKSDLKGLGLQRASASARMVSGQLPIRAIKSMASLVRLKHARPAYALTNVGEVTSQGDIAMGSDNARAGFDVNGIGVTVGVLSDSFDCLNGAAADVNGGDLPEGIVVLAEDPGCSSGTDEGRAIMQLLHDVAPGASLAFHTAFNGQADFASGIQELADLGADVIVDDVIYLAEPMFQDGIIAQAIDRVVADGVAYFSSAGNNGRKGYEDYFSFEGYLGPGFISLPGAPPFYGGNLHDFGGGNVTQAITIPAGATMMLSFQWDDPFWSVCGHPSPRRGCSGADTDMDIYLLDESGLFILAGGVDANIGGDPVEILGVINNGTTDVTVNLIIVQYEGPEPGLMKYVRFGGDQATENEGDGTIYGHANATSAKAVGAAFYKETPAFGQNPPLLESFSSAGPTPILFDASGRSIDPVERLKPEIVAPDGTNTTFFGSDIEEDEDVYPNFFGTSASAPHAAGVAALMLEADSSLFPDEIYAYLEETALDMEVEAPGFDFDSGYGFIQAELALAAILSSPGITVTPTSGLVTTEDGGTATFDVVLNTLPTAGVIIDLYSSDTTEGEISPASLTFNHEDGTTPQTVTVTGMDDIDADGDITYTIITEPAVSDDLDYGGLEVADVAVTNLDNEMADGTMHVGDLDGGSQAMGKKWWKATVVITMHDATHTPVADARVSGTWSGGVSGAVSGTTDANGQCSVTATKIAKSQASVTFTIDEDNTTHAILTYNPNENHDPDGDSNGISITVSQP